MFTFPYSLEGSGIENSGATALADALRVNKSLKTLRYIYLTARHFPRDTSQNYPKQHKHNHCIVTAPNLVVFSIIDLYYFLTILVLNGINTSGLELGMKE